MILKNYRLHKPHLVNRGIHYGYNDVYDLIRSGVEVEIVGVPESQVLLKALKNKEDCKDVALMNRIIRNGGLSEYVRKLNVNRN